MKYRISVPIIFTVIFLTSNFTIADIIRGPYLSDVTHTSIIVSWETSDASSSLVEFAESIKYNASGGAYDQKSEGQDNVKRHSVTLKTLIPSTEYYYRVVSGQDKSEDNTFKTTVRLFKPFILAVYGDTRTNQNDHRAVVNQMIQHKPDLVLNTGDLVENGNVLSQWDIFFDTTKDLMKNVPYYPSLGNHENNSQNYYDFFYLPEGGGKEKEQWYSFNYGNAHIVSLDSNVRSSAEQLGWLEEDLARVADKVQWIFAFFHNPPYSSSSHGSEYLLLANWIELFEKYGVDMVFNGHDHIYERSLSNDIWYIVAGGGGAPLYAVNQKPNPKQVYAETVLHFCKISITGSQLNYEMIRADGTVGDTFTIAETTGIKPAGRLAVKWGQIKANTSPQLF